MKKTKVFYIWFTSTHNGSLCMTEYTGEFKSMKVAQAYADMAVSKNLVKDEFGNPCISGLVWDEKTYTKNNMREKFLVKSLVD